MSLYEKRGVSAQKEEVHAATKHLDQGLFPKAFCKVYPDVLCGDNDWVNVMHADGAGTKSILAYLYWKETGDVSVWKGIAQDAIVMNLDDLPVPHMYTIKSADGNNCIAKQGQIFYIIMDFHKVEQN